MASNLDLEEQEQLDELKHFWNTYGNLITWTVIVVFGGIAAWTGWQKWQAVQAGQAASLYDEVEKAAQAGDDQRLDRAFADIKDKFGGTTFAQQAGLLAAKTYADKGKADGAKAALNWVADKSTDEGLQALAKLRLATVLMDGKQYDEALKLLAGEFPKDFEALAADRRGDVLDAQGKKAEARAEYLKAWQAMEPSVEYRRLVEFKLNALGVDAQQLAAAAGTSAPAASGASK
jgi:predicted negative regulator of RcsB-dependent stress response